MRFVVRGVEVDAVPTGGKNYLRPTQRASKLMKSRDLSPRRVSAVVLTIETNERDRLVFEVVRVVRPSEGVTDKHAKTFGEGIDILPSLGSREVVGWGENAIAL